jgi:signal transduction histidine kinase/CheY-like chemotaxis protein
MVRWARVTPSTLYLLLDWFIPAKLKEESAALQRARMFLISHLFGPFLGHTITIYLYALEPKPDYALKVLALSITVFWAFPFVLRLTGWYTALALLSVQNLIFAILWGCYHYGGVSSPFLPWLLTVPLLAFFYLGPGPKPRLLILTIIAVNLAAFYFVYAAGHSFPSHIPLSKLSGIGIISTLCAAVYVSMMALYYANIVASQTELEHEVQRHLATARKLRESKLEAERANRAKSEFLAKMSHELRTPLNAVIGYSEMLLEETDVASNRQQYEDIMKINGAGKHLLSLVSDVLDLSKLEAGKMEIYSQSFDVPTFIADIADSCRSAVEASGNRLVVECAPDIGMAETDTAKLKQAATYLLNNAAKFTHGGEVKLSAELQDGWLSIAIKDTGPGIGPDHLAHLFQNFSEAEGETSSKYGGTGLGLPLSRKLCRLIGGDLKVESEIGKGSCFTIRVPARFASAESAVWDAGALETAFDDSIEAGSVLLIDDDIVVHDLVERVLAKEGFDVVSASNAVDGLHAARENPPSLILLDIMLPGIDGWEVLRILKADAKLSRCPVILLTVSDDVQRGRVLGAKAHLVKPIDRDELLRVVRRHLDRGTPAEEDGHADEMVASQ